MFIPFHCPTHGQVMQATPNSRVECKCGKECAPEGLTVRQHVAQVLERRKR